MSRILIVEDEANLARGLQFNLELEGFETRIAGSVEEALPLYAEFDMLILDIMLPGADGLTLLKRVRQDDPRLPVLILSAKSAEEDLLAGLGAGADDYMTKPFSLSELLLRVKRMLERRAWYMAQAEAKGGLSVYAFGDYSIDFALQIAQSNKGQTKLTTYECAVMRYLIDNQERAVSRDELLTKVWGYAVAPETRTVDAFIARLRKLFEPDPQKPVHLLSIRDVGYRFSP